MVYISNCEAVAVVSSAYAFLSNSDLYTEANLVSSNKIFQGLFIKAGMKIIITIYKILPNIKGTPKKL